MHFLVKFTLASATESASTSIRASFNSQFQCIRVPRHLRSTHWEDLLPTHSSDLTHELVLHKSQIKHVLSKLESADFIHTYVPTAATAATAATASSIMNFELPRLGLEFELQKGNLVSLEHRGYCLSRQQQLVTEPNGENSSASPPLYTLPGFQQYLLLQRIPSGDVMVGARRADSLVLASAGEVQCSNASLAGVSPSVSVKVKSISNASLKVHRVQGDLLTECEPRWDVPHSQDAMRFSSC